MNPRLLAAALGVLLPLATAVAQDIAGYPVPEGARPHDVAPAPDGTVWYTAQGDGALGRLDPATGKVEHIPLGPESAPHGVIVGPDGAAWVTDGGQNAIVRVDPATKAVKAWPLPEETGWANLNTAAFDGTGTLWFTGQSGWYGSLDPKTGAMRTFKDPDGRGPYGITATPSGEIWFASLAGSHIAKIDTATGEKTRVDPPTPGQGARRVWSDSKGRIRVRSASSIPPARRGAAGSSPATRPGPTPSTSTTPTRSGSATSGPTPSSPSIPRLKPSRAIPATAPRPTCGSCSAARARSGVRSPAPTGW
jgi:virginiamycin B lyase